MPDEARKLHSLTRQRKMNPCCFTPLLVEPGMAASNKRPVATKGGIA